MADLTQDTDLIYFFKIQTLKIKTQILKNVIRQIKCTSNVPKI